MPHTLEETGIILHTVRRLRGTFDLEVDGQYAEVDYE
jgi:hypothetical protein